jgi:hypothetical protein
MCRNIKTLYNFDPPATDAEIHEASLQFVRKLSGFTSPSQTNKAPFNLAVDQVAEAARRLLSSLETTAKPHNRLIEAQRASERAAKRFGNKNT